MADADDPETTPAGDRDASASPLGEAGHAEAAGARQAGPRETGRGQAPAGRGPDLAPALDRSRPAVAVFVDLENMAWSPDTASVTFDLGRMMAYLERSTRPVLRRVYADWSRMRDFRTPFLRHGFEQVQCTYVNATKERGRHAAGGRRAGGRSWMPAGRWKGVVLVTADSDFGPLAPHPQAARGRGDRHRMGRQGGRSLPLPVRPLRVDYETLLADAPRRPAAARPPRPSPPPAAAVVEAAEEEAEDRPFLYDPREDGGDTGGRRAAGGGGLRLLRDRHGRAAGVGVRPPSVPGVSRIHLDVVLDTDLLDQAQLGFQEIDMLLLVVEDSAEQIPGSESRPPSRSTGSPRAARGMPRTRRAGRNPGSP